MSSGKVKCTCGWSWNKSDSSKKDMYICHECGRDNSNNMQNGGWLDNYNDSQASAPEGMVGDGFSNVGRNYSPAWGGLFQEGGEIPMAQTGKKVKYVESKNDPRYRAYQDSLSLYNYNQLQRKLEKKEDYLTPKGLIVQNILAKESKRLVKESNGRLKFGLQSYTGIRDSDSATEKEYDESGSHDIYNRNIKPIGQWSGFGLNNDYSNVKPQQQVIVKPKEKLVPLQPMSVGMQDADQQIVNPDLNINDLRRGPKGYKYNSVEGGNSESGWITSPDQLKHLQDLQKMYNEKEYRNWLGTKNKIDIIPQYQMGGNIYPVNYVPQAQNGNEVSNTSQEMLDLLQIGAKYGGKSILGKIPFGVGSAVGITQSLANEQNPNLSDIFGLVPNGYGQAAALTSMYAEQEKQNLEDYAKRKLKHNSFPKLLKEKTKEQLVNDKKVDNTYVPKPKVEKIKPKTKQIPYVEKKDINPVVIDNTAVGRSRKGFQNGGLTFLQPTSDKLPEGYMKGSSIPSTERAMSIGGENGEPAYLIPSFKYGQELLGPVFDPISEFRRTGEHLGGPFKTWQEADEWERTVRHPAVENRETIMFPQEQFQTGGSMPGATGSMYARIGAPSNGPYAKKTMASAQNGLVTGVKDFYSNYLNSPKYKERLLHSGYSDPNDIINSRLKNIQKTKVKSGPESVYDTKSSTVFIHPDEAKLYNTTKSSILAHELSHAGGALMNETNFELNNFDIDQINKRNKLSGYMDQYVQGKAPFNLEKMHGSKPNEFKADMDVLRYRLFQDKIYDAGKQNFNQDVLNKAKKKYKGDKEVERLFQRANDKDLIWLMNNIAKVNSTSDDQLPMAQNGQEMKFYQEGLDWKPKGMKDGGWLDGYEEGGVIKDDRGQWAHPGEITEINSPYITMKGVSYPVLGISDTGDMQMMYPEEEYEFDGEKVTEYPMAKNGLRQEQKGLVNLDNLLNFTNYNKPQPGGWLNKYN